MTERLSMRHRALHSSSLMTHWLGISLPHFPTLPSLRASQESPSLHYLLLILSSCSVSGGPLQWQHSPFHGGPWDPWKSPLNQFSKGTLLSAHSPTVQLQPSQGMPVMRSVGVKGRLGKVPHPGPEGVLGAQRWERQARSQPSGRSHAFTEDKHKSHYHTNHRAVIILSKCWKAEPRGAMEENNKRA